MKWPFQTDQLETRRYRQEEQSRKRHEATRMLADLFIRRNSMRPSDIIARLEQIHGFYAVPSSEPSEGEPGGYLEEIVKDLAHGSLTPHETERLVGMLSWSELRASEDRTASSRLVTIAVDNPSERHIPPLREHLRWLEEQAKPRQSSQYQTDIAYEIRLTKGAIQACHLRP